MVVTGKSSSISQHDAVLPPFVIIRTYIIHSPVWQFRCCSWKTRNKRLKFHTSQAPLQRAQTRSPTVSRSTTTNIGTKPTCTGGQSSLYSCNTQMNCTQLVFSAPPNTSWCWCTCYVQVEQRKDLWGKVCALVQYKWGNGGGYATVHLMYLLHVRCMTRVCAGLLPAVS